MPPSPSNPSRPFDRPASKADPKYRELKRVRDPDGVVAIVTERVSDGRISFSIGKEFDYEGEVRTSSFLRPSHIPAVVRILNDLQDELELVEDRTRSKRRES